MMLMIHLALAHLKRLRSDEKGVTALEYALIAALIAGAIVTAATTLGTDIANELTAIGGKL